MNARDSGALRGRSLITMRDHGAEEIELLLDAAAELKELRGRGVFERRLEHRNIAMVFIRPSLRTRMSFVVAASEEGAHLESFAAEDLRFGYKESTADLARVIGPLWSGLALRGVPEDTLRELAAWSGLPVWNGLSDGYHPTQVLADLLTIRECFGDLRAAPIAYVGDGRNNQARSLAVAAQTLGLDLRVLAPAPLQLDPAWLAELRGGRHASEAARIVVTDEPGVALAGAKVVYNDVWVSMGEDALLDERVRLLAPYKVTAELMERTGSDDAIYLHCLPALHDAETEFARAHPGVQEVDDDVFESAASKVFAQAENRLHTIKALMVLSCAS